MDLVKECFGRQFSELKNFDTLGRIPGRPSSNYLTTVENGFEIDNETQEKSDKAKYRIQRWRAINDKNKKDTKYWKVTPKWCTHFNINSNEQLEDLSNILNDLVVGKDTVTLTDEQYKKIQEQSRSQEVKIQNLLEQIRNLKTLKSVIEAERQTYKQRLLVLKNNITDLRSVLNHYKDLVLDPNSNETEIKNFIDDNNAYWMFGLEYVGIKREVGIPFGKGEKDYFIDFTLQRYDDYLDIVECKGPNDSLFIKQTKKRYRPNPKLSEAIEQVFTYFCAIDKLGDEKVIKPRAYIIIGKQEKDVPNERQIFSSYLSNTEILTYTDLFERGNQLLKHIRKMRNE